MRCSSLLVTWLTSWMRTLPFTDTVSRTPFALGSWWLLLVSMLHVHFEGSLFGPEGGRIRCEPRQLLGREARFHLAPAAKVAHARFRKAAARRFGSISSVISATLFLAAACVRVRGRRRRALVADPTTSRTSAAQTRLGDDALDQARVQRGVLQREECAAAARLRAVAGRGAREALHVEVGEGDEGALGIHDPIAR